MPPDQTGGLKLPRRKRNVSGREAAQALEPPDRGRPSSPPSGSRSYPTSH